MKERKPLFFFVFFWSKAEHNQIKHPLQRSSTQSTLDGFPHAFDRVNAQERFAAYNGLQACCILVDQSRCKG